MQKAEGRMGQRFLIDTNILVYYFDDQIPEEVDQDVDTIFDQSFNISVISKIEFLGWQKYTEEEYKRAVEFLAGAQIFSLNEITINRTIQLRRQKRMKLPDAVIAATCLINKLTIVTRNEKDFEDIEDLAIYNPFKESLEDMTLRISTQKQDINNNSILKNGKDI
jgi:predicted nucleic acid-binding protein